MTRLDKHAVSEDRQDHDHDIRGEHRDGNGRGFCEVD
jgi:hypothetical protein